VEILLLTIGLPTIGLLMLLCWRAMIASGIGGSELRQKQFLSVLSMLLLLSVIPLAFLFVNGFFVPFFHVGVLLLSLVRAAVIGIVIATALAARRVANEPYRDDPTVALLALRASHLRTLFLGSMAIIALPLLALGAVPLLLGWSLGLGEYFLFEFVTKSRRCRVLWGLSIAAQGRRPFADELIQLSKAEGRRQREKLLRVADSLEQGNPLSQALSIVPKLLPRELVAAIQAGEQTGQLNQVLSSLARQQLISVKNWFQLDQKIFSVFSYLSGSLLLFIAVLSFISHNLVPKFKAILSDFDMDVPTPMHSLIQFADFWSSYWFLSVPFLVVPLAFVVHLALIGLGHEGRQTWIADVLWPRIRAPGLLRSLSVTVQGNARPTAMLEGTLLGMEPSLERSRLERLSRRLEDGDSLSSALKQEQFLNRREEQALELAEQRGHLAWGLESLARRIETSRLNRVQTVSEVLGPIVVLLIGAAVFWVALAVLSVILTILNIAV